MRYFYQKTFLENISRIIQKLTLQFGCSNPIQISVLSRFSVFGLGLGFSTSSDCLLKLFLPNFWVGLKFLNFLVFNFVPGKCFVCCFAINRRLLLLEFVSIGSRISFPPLSLLLSGIFSILSLAPSLSLFLYFRIDEDRSSEMLQLRRVSSMAPRVAKKWKNSLWTKRPSARIKKRAKVMLLLIFTKPNDR